MKVLVSIKDQAVEAFGPIMEVRANGEALRMFIDEVNNPDSRINKHPQDFDLYKMAMYDEQTGEIEPLNPPERIARAVDIKGAAI